MSFNASIAGHASDEVQNKVKQLLKDIVNTAEHGITLAHFNGENLIVELVPEVPAAPTQAPVEEENTQAGPTPEETTAVQAQVTDAPDPEPSAPAEEEPASADVQNAAAAMADTTEVPQPATENAGQDLDALKSE
jgi:hypothetical protein